ncbi:hypothetical protein J2W42_005729 [Rhizobium tibeticum]|nr:hypothetical protein [Rhizobium tibeticum]
MERVLPFIKWLPERNFAQPSFGSGFLAYDNVATSSN